MIAALPKADLHLHQESKARLDLIAARREGRPPVDRRTWARNVMLSAPPGMARLAGIYAPDNALDLEAAPDDDANFVVRVADVLEEGARDGAVLIEVRFGADELLVRPEFMTLFREAERRARERYPRLCAEAIGYLGLVNDPEWLAAEERKLEACLQAAKEGLAGVDFRIDPYETEAAPQLWAIAYRFAKRAADAGLGITVHAGEFSTANLEAALRMPGLRRVGHAVYAAHDPRLMDALARSGATVECSLTCNVVLGALPSYEAHPIRRFVGAGVPVTLSTDLPAHVCTSIGREYAVAAALGFSPGELIGFTRNAISASFAPAERRAALLDSIDAWKAASGGTHHQEEAIVMSSTNADE
jgi:adenosine deaminase